MSVGDCIGSKFNRLIVLDEFRENNKTYCKCVCDCKNKCVVLKSQLKNGKTKSCGCINKKYKDIKIGDVFNKLTVIDYSDKTDKWYGKYFVCKCECGKELVVNKRNLNNGNTKSCGCIKGQSFMKQNTYNLNSNCGIGYSSNTNKEFLFDLEDYDKIKNICWYENKNGYMVNRTNNKTIYLHKMIMNILDNNEIIDHINRNPLDNRKENLRIATIRENSMNGSKRNTNKSGIIGVCWGNNERKWISYITVNYKHKHLGRFDNKKDAIISRLNAELKYFGEFAPQRHLFKEYGIGDEK